MRYLISTICLVLLLLVVGCNSELEVADSSNKNFRLWLASDESTFLRTGYLADPNTEIGGEFSWWDCSDEPRSVGVYVIRHSSDGLVQVPNPFPLEGWPETFEGTTYYGARQFWDTKENITRFSPFGGIRLEDLFFTEVRANTNEPAAIMFGIQRDF